MRVLPRNVLYHGRDEPPAERIELRAGVLSMIFEPETAFLRYIRIGDREIVRGIYAAVRDQHWRTILPRVSNLQVKHTGAGFRVTFDVECREREVHVSWRGTITGEPDGTVTFAMDGIARSTFLRNRIGICVLHPIAECAGRLCVVEKVDGTIEQDDFPHYIKPHQPFTDMRAISHEVLPGLRAEVRFEGDVFEMEDQRNWTDASFKTYSGPLRRPLPVEVKEGTRIAQSVTVRLKGKMPAELPAAPADAPEVVFAVGNEPPVPLPRIGLGVASHGQPLTDAELERLKALNLAHLRVDLKLSQPEHRDVLAQAALQADQLGVSLEAAVSLTDAAEEELSVLVHELEKAKARVATWLIFHEAEKPATERWVQLARRHLSSYDPEAEIGAGSSANFTELNRERPEVDAIDLTCYPVTPQVHTFDNASMVETLRTQGWTVESARQFVGDLPIAVSPVTLKRRFDPHVTGPEAGAEPGELPPPVDARQMSIFGGAWTLGSLKYLSESGAGSVTYYETTGWRGVMETESGSPVPEMFRSIPGAVFPLYHVFADVGEFAGGSVVRSASSAPLRVDGMVLENEGRRCILLANMSPEPQQVRVLRHGLGARARVRRLDETNAEQAMRQPEAFREDAGELVAMAGDELELSLAPYAYVRVDGGEGGPS